MKECAANPLVSVIMPVYNGACYLSDAISSVLEQTYSNLELVVIDDCSTDNSQEAIEKFSYDERVKYLKTAENQGVSGARNIGIVRCQGELVAFLDQDDCWLPRKLELQVSCMEKCPDIALVHANVALMDESGKMERRYEALGESQFENDDASLRCGFVFDSLFVSNEIQVLTVLIRRSALEAVGNFDERLSGVDDYELWLRVAREFSICHMNTILAKYIIHAGQVSRNGYKMLELRIAALEGILERYPEIEDELDSEVVVERMFKQYKALADYYFFHKKNYKDAKRMYGKTIRMKKGDRDVLIRYAYSALPSFFRTVVKKFRGLGGWRSNSV